MLAKTAQGKGFGPQIPDPPRHTLGALGRILEKSSVDGSASERILNQRFQGKVPSPCWDPPRRPVLEHRTSRSPGPSYSFSSVDKPSPERMLPSRLRVRFRRSRGGTLRAG